MVSRGIEKKEPSLTRRLLEGTARNDLSVQYGKRKRRTQDTPEIWYLPTLSRLVCVQPWPLILSQLYKVG